MIRELVTSILLSIEGGIIFITQTRPKSLQRICTCTKSTQFRDNHEPEYTSALAIITTQMQYESSLDALAESRSQFAVKVPQ